MVHIESGSVDPVRDWLAIKNSVAICDVISSGNVKTIEDYAVLNFEVSSFSSFWDIPQK